MSWGAVAGAAIGVVGSQIGKDKKGGAGTTTSTNEPWSESQWWLKNLLRQGSDLTAGYFVKPMCDRQTAAYDNQYALSDSARSLAPSLLGQLGSQPLGFDPSNPTARAKSFDWTDFMAGLSANQKPVSGLSSMSAVLPEVWGRGGPDAVAAVKGDQTPGILPVEEAQLANRNY